MKDTPFNLYQLHSFYMHSIVMCVAVHLHLELCSQAASDP